MEELREANESQNKVTQPSFSSCALMSTFLVSQARRTMLCLAIALVFILFCIVVFLLGKF
jgi:hypothetical protein